MHIAEHLNPLFEQIAKLEEALYNIQFEQHWLEAQTDQQAIGTVLTNDYLVANNSFSFHLLYAHFSFNKSTGYLTRHLYGFILLISFIIIIIIFKLPI